MKIPLSWISLSTDIDSLLTQKNTTEIAHHFSTHTAEIEAIETCFFDKVVIGKVLTCEKHPDSKKLSIVEIDVGWSTPLTILTGAPNISEAHYVPVALVWAVLAGGFTIGERMMAGMKSAGMICGIDEVWLSRSTPEWIMILENIWDSGMLEKMIGTSFYDLTLPFPGHDWETASFSLRDTVFEIDNKSITNRPDLFSIRGNAREFHTLFNTPPLRAQSTLNDRFPVLDIYVQTPLCLAYNALKIDNISVSRSPFWLSLMMERAWLTPKLDCIDITNAIMIELWQPMHVFDAERIVGNITIRLARKGESILALDNRKYDLLDHDIVIADDEKVLAIAWIIGGVDSAVSENSKHIIFESACFDAPTIRLTAQRLGIRTEASTRFEKSLDPTLARTSIPRILDYLKFLWKNVSPVWIYNYEVESSPINITVPYSFLDWKIGVVIEKENTQNILERLGFWVELWDDTMNIEVPSWRATKDISTKEDIAEEIARVSGYEHIGEKPLVWNIWLVKKNLMRDTELRALSHFSQRGWDEVYNYSFSNATLDTMIWYRDQSDAIKVTNAFNIEYTHMRRSLAGRLLLNLKENQKYQKSLSFFEVGNVSAKNNIFREKKVLGGITTKKGLELVRSDIESFLQTIVRGAVLSIHQACVLPFLHPNVTGQYGINGETVWTFGAIHPETQDAFELVGDVYYFELDLEKIVTLRQSEEFAFHDIQRYPSIPRELNFIIPERLPIWEVALSLDAIHPWISHVTVSSIFQDFEKIGPWKKSVTFHFFLGNPDATLSDSDAWVIQNLIIEAMKNKGYVLRGI